MVFFYGECYDTSMIRIAILETEKETKDILYSFVKIMSHMDWNARHFTKASLLLKACKDEAYQFFVCDELFKTSRFESVFVNEHPNALFIFVCQDPSKYLMYEQRERILYISKDSIMMDMAKYAKWIIMQSRQSDLYNLVYGGINVNIPYDQIYYIEKIDKLIYFHTRMGEFHQRTSMARLDEIFVPYGFLRVHVSYLVNAKYIVSWKKDEVELIHSLRVPCSRAQKRKIFQEKRQSKTSY